LVNGSSAPWTAAAPLPLSCRQPAAVGSSAQNAFPKIQLDQTQSSQRREGAKLRFLPDLLSNNQQFTRAITVGPEMRMKGLSLKYQNLSNLHKALMVNGFKIFKNHLVNFSLNDINLT
jgi:hypothetical protein